MQTPVKTWEQRQKEEGYATVDAQLEEITELRALCQSQAETIDALNGPNEKQYVERICPHGVELHLKCKKCYEEVEEQFRLIEDDFSEVCLSKSPCKYADMCNEEGTCSNGCQMAEQVK